MADGGEQPATDDAAKGNARRKQESYEGYVRPPRERLEKDPKAFSEFIRYAAHLKKITQAELIDRLDDLPDKTTLSRWIATDAVPKKHRLTILKYIYGVRMLFADDWSVFLDNVPAPLFHALVKFFDVKPTSIDNARAHVVGTMKANAGPKPVGTYALWRYSVEDDDEFVFGKLEFNYREETGAIHVDMSQPKKAVESDAVPFAQRAALEQFEGYFFRVADMYVMLLRDIANNDLRVTIFNKYRIEPIDDANSVHPNKEMRIVQMDGFGLGIDGNNLFVSPVHVELVHLPEQLAALNDALDVLPPNRVPARVVKRLSRHKLIRE
jgi:hypothetical protein